MQSHGTYDLQNAEMENERPSAGDSELDILRDVLRLLPTGVTVQTVQYYGNTSTNTTGTNFPDWQRIYGTNDQRITRLQSAFTKIMQSGIQVSLIQ